MDISGAAGMDFAGITVIGDERHGVACGCTRAPVIVAEGRPAKATCVPEWQGLDRVWGVETRGRDARSAAANHHDLRAFTASGACRADLYDWLRVLPVPPTPLEEQTANVAPSANAMLAQVLEPWAVSTAGRSEVSRTTAARQAPKRGVAPA